METFELTKKCFRCVDLQLKLLKEKLEVDHSKNTTMLRDKLEALKNNELLEHKVKTA